MKNTTFFNRKKTLFETGLNSINVIFFCYGCCCWRSHDNWHWPSNKALRLLLLHQMREIRRRRLEISRHVSTARNSWPAIIIRSSLSLSESIWLFTVHWMDTSSSSSSSSLLLLLLLVVHFLQLSLSLSEIIHANSSLLLLLLARRFKGFQQQQQHQQQHRIYCFFL